MSLCLNILDRTAIFSIKHKKFIENIMSVPQNLFIYLYSISRLIFENL